MTGFPESVVRSLRARKRLPEQVTPWSVVRGLNGHLSPSLPEPTQLLCSLIKARNWNAVASRLSEYPWDAACVLKDGRTALHLACLRRAPGDIVARLLQVHPALIHQQDTEGWTPLHVHLLYAHPDQEATTLFLIEAAGVLGVSRPSYCPGASLPLHLASRHGCSSTILRALLKQNPATARLPTESKTFAANLLVQGHVRLHGPVLQGNDDGNRKQHLVQQLVLLMMAAQNRSLTETMKVESIQLADAVAFQYECGSETNLVSLLLKLYPEHMIGQVATALQTACTYPPLLASSGTIQPIQDPLLVLVEASPHSASQPKVENGRLPIHTALQTSRRTWKHGICALVTAFSSGLQRPDPLTNLVPFQLAATATVNPCGDETKQRARELEQLETIFQLLRACPPACAVGREKVASENN